LEEPLIDSDGKPKVANETNIPIFGYVLVKLASRCNLACTYCYWFRDNEVYKLPSLLEESVEDAFCKKLDVHLREYELDRFQILFHGGEPLLFPKRRFAAFMDKIISTAKSIGVTLDLILTTNAALIDGEWIELFKHYRIGISVSVDGPQEIHDRHRIDHKGRGSYDSMKRGLTLLKEAGLGAGVIAVCNPETKATDIADHIVSDLGVNHFDVLPPDYTHEDNAPAISQYYIELFDYWYGALQSKSVGIRFFEGIIETALGREPKTDSIGYAPVHTVTLLPDGKLEALDVLRIAGAAVTRSTLNIFDHSFQDVEHDATWMNAFDASINLAAKCRECDIVKVCGGGHLAHRYSKERLYDNASVYCEDLTSIVSHVIARVADDVFIVNNDSRVPLSKLTATQWKSFVRPKVTDAEIQYFGDLFFSSTVRNSSSRSACSA
jgi:uncharacterized protein